MKVNEVATEPDAAISGGPTREGVKLATGGGGIKRSMNTVGGVLAEQNALSFSGNAAGVRMIGHGRTGARGVPSRRLRRFR